MKIDFQSTEVPFQDRSTSELRQSLFIFSLLNNPNLVKAGSKLAKIALSMHLPIREIIRATVFKQFCGGETLEESLTKAERMAKYGIHTILDVAVEGGQSEEIFNRTTTEILRTIELAKEKSFLPFSVFKVSGIASFELLEKIQTKAELTQEEKKAWEKAQDRILNLCESAYHASVPLLIDAEDYCVQNCIDDIALEMMRKFNKEKPIIYNTVQMYRKDRMHHLENLIETANKEKFIYAVKLVRGAYLEKERERAIEKGYLTPVFETKEKTDHAYNEALKLLVQHKDNTALVAGTHNEISTQVLIDEMEKAGIGKNDKRFYFSQLFGMSDHLSYHLAKNGYLVAKYLPYGEVRILLPYLIRRAEENTAVHGQTPRELLLLRKEIIRRKG